MSENAMSREAMLSGLQDIRLPPEAAGGMAAEFAVAAGLAAVAAFLAVAVVRALSLRRVAKQPPSLAGPESLREPLSDEARRVALLHLLKETAPERYQALQGRLYRPEGLPLAEIETEVARLA